MKCPNWPVCINGERETEREVQRQMEIWHVVWLEKRNYSHPRCISRAEVKLGALGLEPGAIEDADIAGAILTYCTKVQIPTRIFET